MKARLKIAYSDEAFSMIGEIEGRKSVRLEDCDLPEAAAVIITKKDRGIFRDPHLKAFGIPVFLIVREGEELCEDVLGEAYGILDLSRASQDYYKRQIESAAEQYEARILPPFFKSLMEYVERGNTEFDCPGHQGGEYFRKHPGGRIFYDFYGENAFRSDLCNADVDMGHLLIHEGMPLKAQQHAAKVFHADKAYFILNVTSGANKVVMNALLSPGDLVLYERNNHKSMSYGALIQAGAIPI